MNAIMRNLNPVMSDPWNVRETLNACARRNETFPNRYAILFDGAFVASPERFNRVFNHFSCSDSVARPTKKSVSREGSWKLRRTGADSHPCFHSFL